MKPIDLWRAIVTDHATERWVERVELPPGRLRPALSAARPAPRRLRRRVREGYRAGRWPGPTRLFVHRPTGAVFVLKPDFREPDGSVPGWVVVTILPLWACRGGGDVCEIAEDGPCAIASH